SPRWFQAHGYTELAETTAREMERRVALETGGQLPPPEAAAEEIGLRRGAWIEIWRPPYLGRTLMLTIFNAFQAIGFYGFAAWVPVLLVSEGIEVTKSLSYVLAIAMLNPVGSMIATRYADRLQRKWQIVA